jgi:hypothetical protein
MVYRPSSIVQRVGGSGWESNPPRLATRPATGFEDQEAHRDLTAPVRKALYKDNRMKGDWQASLKRIDGGRPGYLYEIGEKWKQQNTQTQRDDT